MDNNIHSNQGQIRFEVVSQINHTPIRNVNISISYTGGASTLVEETSTDANGMTPIISLQAPDWEFSQTPTDNQPYSEYNCRVEAEGYEAIYISGIQIFPDEVAVQRIHLRPILEQDSTYNPIIIDGHTLWENYPQKIAEAEIKSIQESGEIVLDQVVIPEYVVVHDGSPTDSTANNYYIRYKDYIKNVASCEIYSTWPIAAIEANVLAIMSFTLNRVYTEWYRNQGYSYTITSSTAFDHKWINGKSTYESIDEVVDRLYTSYLSRPNVRQPILTQ